MIVSSGTPSTDKIKAAPKPVRSLPAVQWITTGRPSAARMSRNMVAYRSEKSVAYSR